MRLNKIAKKKKQLVLRTLDARKILKKKTLFYHIRKIKYEKVQNKFEFLILHHRRQLLHILGEIGDLLGHLR